MGYELRDYEAKTLVNRALSRARTSAHHVPMCTIPTKPLDDEAQLPITSSLSPFSKNLDGPAAALQQAESTGRVEYFGARGRGRQMVPSIDGHDDSNSVCDVGTWFEGLSCPRA